MRILNIFQSKYLTVVDLGSFWTGQNGSLPTISLRILWLDPEYQVCFGGGYQTFLRKPLFPVLGRSQTLLEVDWVGSCEQGSVEGGWPTQSNLVPGLKQILSKF